jgi:molybdopterin synthase sulfur carrier subunit
MKTIRIRYFASVREALGGGETVHTDAGTLAGLRDELIARGGAHATALAHGLAARMARDQVMSREDAELADGAEIAFFPPVTGG